MIFETYIETGSLSKVYDLLKKKNIKNRQGNPFYKTVLGYLLRNIVYTGKIKYAGQIYQGIHQPIISEEIFDLAGQIHKKRLRKFRIYKNFLFGGLVNCKECGSKMTSCFTNKKRNGNLKRYFYYRCTSTMKQDWKTCSTKQVSAERLKNYILENLERISLDKNYIENLVFKLNHNLKTPHRTGYEPSRLCSKFPKFSVEIIISALKSFVSVLSQKKGIERNLLVKNFIKKIIYSKENIEILLYYRQNPENFKDKTNPALLEQGGTEKPNTIKKDSVFSQNQKFVFRNLAPRVGLEPTT